ncbi:hypothetical protein GLOIN_2v1762476 [Rhizophagus irregularis DAOM 181602=DAOM 197198]|nr:hypothetical protein GLOIN_2v1762476 [Rhizophagus irregularis DAOM 181602=DAOM 197198]
MLLAQKKPGPSPKTINEAIRLFSGLADLVYDPGYNNHVYFQYSDIHECIDGNLLLRLVLDIDARQILIACTDIINSDLNHFIILDAFALASSSNANKCSWHIVYPYAHFIDYRDLEGFVKKVADRIRKPYSVFIDFDLYKSRFSLRLLGSAKEDRVKGPAISSIKIGYCKLENYLPKKEEFQPIEDKTALSVRAGLVIAKYGWLEIGDIRKEFINFQARNGCFVLKCYRQKNYKPDHKGLAFRKVTEVSAKSKRGIVERIGDAISNPRPLIELSEMMINVEKLKDASEVYPN